MIGKGLSAKTIRDSKLVALRVIMQWGVKNRRLSENPAAAINMDVKRKLPHEKIRSVNDREAIIILRAAQQAVDPVKRWSPLLCAYSGARISEVCQLRVEDIIQIDKIWCMKFDPSAGDLKNGYAERTVPLHQAVIDGGFLDYILSLKSGPIFPNLPKDMFGSRGGNGVKRMIRMIRKLGLTDERLHPNHSWRHRMKTLGRRHDISLDLVNAITGHSGNSVADDYGEYEIPALHRALKKIPAVDLK